MPRKPRWLRGDGQYCEVQRAVDRQFFFLPCEIIRNIIGAAIGRALELFPVKLYWIDFNINHKHCGRAPLSDSPEHLDNLVKFDQLVNSLIARGINAHLGREGALFSSRSHSTEARDDESLEQQLYYSVLNPVKDGLVDRIAAWKGFSSYEQLAHGTEETFTYVDWTAWHATGGNRRKKPRPIAEFTRTTRVKLTPLPAWESLTPDQRQANFRREVRRREAAYRAEREAAGRTVLGPAKLAKLDQRDRPRTPPIKRPKPLCHAASLEDVKEYKEQLKEFLDQYYKASALWPGFRVGRVTARR